MKYKKNFLPYVLPISLLGW